MECHPLKGLGFHPAVKDVSSFSPLAAVLLMQASLLPTHVVLSAHLCTGAIYGFQNSTGLPCLPCLSPLGLLLLGFMLRCFGLAVGGEALHSS